ncbi:hypothetical protein BDW74DRAFT_148660 [Aspergillus multicolor]|uniref:putative C6 transcription factor n=1 Tax=Aspergillus multicolor TaxID=41759 RepID=UPI003CCD95A5
MQSLVLPPSFVPADFVHLRFPGPERHLLNRPRSANARRYTPRDIPLPSMSSTVPADDPLDTLGNVRRPGHPELPKPVTTAVTSAGAAVTSAVPRVTPSTPPDHVTAREPALPRYVTGPSDEAYRQPLSYGDAFSSRIPPTFTGQPTAGPSTVTYPPTFGAGATGVLRTLPQKTTRRTKAHVASACVNCKKKHLGCDPARPCRRCVLSGKADTCVDVTHKKRGRPPLKADEGSLRTYATQMDQRCAPTDAGQVRRPMHRATSSRELRPMTDLQIQPQPGMMGGRLPPGQQQRWPAVYPHTIDPSLTTQRAIGHRRFSSSGSTQSLASVSPTGYVPMPAGYNPALAAGRMPPGVGVGRPIPYPSPGMYPTPSPPQYQHYGIPISPYPDNSRVVNRMPMSEVAVPAPRDPREGYAESPVRLPPIYPSPVPNPQPPPQAHRVGEQYMGTWTPPPQQTQDLRQQGFMEPISPSNLMRPTQATADVGQPQLQSQYVDGSSLDGQAQLPATRSYDDQREQGHETDESDSSRPAKRRKMALETMVND